MIEEKQSFEEAKKQLHEEKERRERQSFRLAQKLDYELLKKQLLQNVKNTNSKTYAQYTKDRIKSYIQSPGTNVDNLREVSRFLSRNSMIYKKFMEY